jgi:nitronate monooxygenase
VLNEGLEASLGVRLPIVQAPIGSATTPELAAGVSNAGALGSLAVSWRDLQATEDIIRRTQALTPHPFAVNVVLAWPQAERIEIALESGVPIIWTAWGAPTTAERAVHAAGAHLIHTVGTVADGLAAAEAGVDVIVTQGREAGGHVLGTLPWLALLSGVRELLPDQTLLVAGGMADGRDLRTAIDAGADGAVLGTRFLCATEADVAPAYQDAIINAGEGDTVLTDLFDKGWPGAMHRVIRNSTVRMWEVAGQPPPGRRPGERDRVATDAKGSPVERYSDTIPTRQTTGDLEALALYAGESSAKIDAVRPAAEIVSEIAAGP